MRVLFANLLIASASLSFGQSNITVATDENSKPWSVHFEYSPLNIPITKSYEDRVANSPRPVDVSNINTHQLGVSVFKNKNSFSFGVAASTYSFRQNLKLKVPNDLIEGVTQYSETNQTFFRQKFALSGEVQYKVKKFVFGLRIGVYSTFRQNNIEKDGYLNISNFNNNFGRKQIEVEEKWHAGESKLTGSISRFSIQYEVLKELRLGFTLTYNDLLKSQEKLYYTIKVKEDLDWSNSASPPVINNLRLFEPLWMAGFNIVYIPNF